VDTLPEYYNVANRQNPVRGRKLLLSLFAAIQMKCKILILPHLLHNSFETGFGAKEE